MLLSKRTENSEGGQRRIKRIRLEGQRANMKKKVKTRIQKMVCTKIEFIRSTTIQEVIEKICYCIGRSHRVRHYPKKQRILFDNLLR